MSRVRQELSIVQFQVENRQASASMDALRKRAKKLNEDITATTASIEALGNVAPDDAGLKDFQKKLKELNSDLRDVTRAQNELMKGVKAADKLWKAAATGTVESLSVKEIKAGQRGIQTRMQNLQPSKENARELQAMRIAIEEGEIAMRKFEADAEHLLKVISEGGAVSSSVLSKTKNDLAGLLDVLPRGTEEYKRYDAQLQAIEKHISTLSQTEKRLAGEIVTVEDARKRAAAADADEARWREILAQQSKQQATADRERAEGALQIAKTNTAWIEQDIAKTKEQLAAQQQLVGSIEALEDAESQAFSKMLVADTALQKQREETNKFSDAAWEAAKKVGELKMKLEELDAQGSAPKSNQSIEELKKDLHEAELQLLRVKNALQETTTASRWETEYDEAMKAHGVVTGKAKPAKIKPGDYAAQQNDPRVVMRGVYHDESGFGVVTEGHVLIYDKNLYDEKNKGKIIASQNYKKDQISPAMSAGDEIQGRYPRWQAVSTDVPYKHSGKADLDALSDFLAGVNEREKEAWKQAKEAGETKATLKDWMDSSSVVMKLPDGQYAILGTTTLTKTVAAAKEMGASEMSWNDGDETSIRFTGKRGGVLAMRKNGLIESERNQNYAYDMSGGGVSSVSPEEAKAKIAQLEQEVAAKKKLIEVAEQEQQSTQASVDVDKQKAELQQQLADAQQKLNEAKTAAEGPTKKLQEAEAAYTEAQKKEQEATEALAKAKGNMNLGEEEDKLDALERKHDDLTESLQKQKQAETELAQNAADTRQKEQEAAIELAQAQNQSEESLKKSVEVLEQQNKTLEAGSAEWIENEQAIGKLNKRIEELKQQSQELRGEVMSLAEAEELADKAMEEQALTTKTGWAASTEELKRAEQTLADKVAKAKRGTAEEEAAYQKLVRQLQAVRTELGAGSMSGKQMMDVLSNPKNVTSVDTLKAAIGRARQELDALGRRLDQAKQSGQTGEVKKLQKVYDDLAKSVQQTDIRMKELQNSSKGTASAFDKAWSRLKTYVGLYVGAAVAMQKFTGAMGDLMELSDKMGEVRKTTGFTADEVGRLSKNLAKLDTRTTLTELMEISAAAGTLGLKTMEDVEGFTEAANKLMVALPEMGKDAATSIMRVALATGEIDKIRQQMNDGVIEGSSATAVAMEKIGSTIDRLRASSASTAPAITDFVSRVGAVGAQSNISIDQVAALGSTISSLGMRVEMSATALSRMIPAIKNNAFDVARAIGMAPEALREMFDEAGGGMNAMLAIFQHIKDSGMDAENIEQQLGMGGMADIMKDLNQQGARAGIVFAGLSQNVEELRRQLGIAHTAYEENIAIQEEYDRMNETTAAKWERLKNQVEEMFVGNTTQSGLGVLIDWLRKLVDLVSGPLNTAFWATASAVGAIKLGLTSLPAQGGKILDYLRESAERASEALEKAANSTNAISQAAQGVEGAADAVDEIGDALEGAQEAGEQAGDAMETATGAIQNMTGATKVSIFSVNGLKAAWKGLDTTMKANIIVAVLALLWTLGKAIYNVVTEVAKANKAIGEANAMIQIAIDRFEGYWQKLQETASALDRAKEATQGLKEGSDELTKATVEVTKADNAHRTAIADINGIYGKYLGFMLTEANYANLNAAAHDKVAAAIRREMLAKQQQAAIDQVTQEHTEKLKEDLSSLSEELRKNNRLTNEQAAQAKTALQAFLRQNIKYDADEGEFVINQAERKKLQKQGYDVSNASTSEFIAVWFNQYLKDTFHLDKYARRDITGITETGNKRWGTFIDFGNLRGDYANTYLDYIKDLALTQDVFAGEMSSATKDDRKATQTLLKKLQNEADAAKKKIADKSTSEQERNKAYEELANALEGMDSSIDQLDPMMDKRLIADIKAQADNISKAVDKDKLIRARTNARSIFARATGGNAGYTPEIPLTPEKNPWGERLPAESTDWRNMTAEQLVNRRKQMRDFVNAIQTDSDVKTVLKEDAALRKAIEKGMSSDMRTVIEWYNTERLKIQDELHARYLTNTGDWMDPTKQKARAKTIKDEWSAYLNELDAYYTERKTRIQEAATEEGITEAEVKNRTLANEMEWHQRRAELQKLYARKSGEVTEEEQQAIFDILSDRTGDTADFIQATIGKTVQFIYDIGKHSEAEMRDIFGKLDKGIERDYLKQQQAVTTQMKAIRDIIEKERPYDGITTNLRENLVTMGILTADMTEERNRLMRENADMSDFNSRQATEEVKRTAFLLGEAENAYSTTIEEVMRHMGEQGMQAWADAIRGDTQMQQALMAQLRTAYDEIQNAIKKEASLIKKQTDIWWADIAEGQTQSRRDGFEQALSRLGLAEDQVKRANSLIGAGQASERVADKLAIKQMQVRLAMQMTYYNRMRQIGEERIRQLEAAKRYEDAEHLRRSLNLAKTEELKKLEEQRVAIANQLEESQNRLYTELKSWADLLTSSLQSVFEATHAGDAEYYNELAKLNLTGNGGPGAGTYMVIDNEGTSDATAHYEYLDEREALERQHEIERESAQAEAWKKVMDDINMKMSETITDQLNAMLQNASIDANTDALGANTQALLGLTEAITDESGKVLGSGDMGVDENGVPNALRPPMEGENGSVVGGSPVGTGTDYTPEWQQQPQGEQSDWQAPMAPPEVDTEAYTAPWVAYAEASTKATKTMTDNNKKAEKSTKQSFAAMTAAANMYGIAYQAMSNENLSTAQKVEMMIVQAAGQAMISMLTASLAADTAETASHAPSWISKTLKELGPIGGPVAVGVFTALIGGLMGLATSKITKSKSQIAQVTGASSASAGRLSTGMLTYAEGNVNEFTDPSTLREGRQYNVDAADGRTYRARYMGRNPKTHLTNGPEFHLSGERGREMIIDAGTTRQITMNEGEIWHAIQTLSGGGRISALRRRGRGVAAFADGNVEDFVDGSVSGDSVAGMSGMSAEQMAAFQASLDRNSEIMERIAAEGIKGVFDVYGKGGLVDSYDSGKKTLNRYGQKY